MSDLEQFVMTKPAPLVWAHLVTPRPERVVQGEKYASQYEATFLFAADHPDLAAIRQLLGKTASGFDKFADKLQANKAAGRPPFDGLKFPLENGNKLAEQGAAKGKDREFARGMGLLKGKANVAKRDGTPLSPPRLVVLQNGRYVRYNEEHERPLAKKFFYSGVLAIGTFAFVPYTGMGGGITCYLNEVLSLNAGDKIATGVDDEAKYGDPNTFKGYIGQVSAEDPMAGAEAAEIPW